MLKYLLLDPLLNKKTMIYSSFITIFILSVFIGYYVILKITSALHAPLMAVTNAISSIIIVTSLSLIELFPKGVIFWFLLIAIFLATINIVGGLFITKRMLKLFEKK